MELFYFLFTFVFIYLFYYFTVIKKEFPSKNKTKKKNSKRVKMLKRPVEVEYLVKQYKIDLKKINYKKLLHTIGVVISLEIALIITIIGNIKEFYLQLGIAFIIMIPLVFITFKIIAKIYKKEEKKNV